MIAINISHRYNRNEFIYAKTKLMTVILMAGTG